MTLHKSLRTLKQISNINPLLINYQYRTEIYKDIGNKIKRWRIRIGMSTRETANLLNISKTYYNDMENGRRNPQPVVIKIIQNVW